MDPMISTAVTRQTSIHFGLLSTARHPLLPFFLAAAISSGVRRISVFCDSKQFTQKDRQIFAERTGGAFDTDGEFPDSLQGFATSNVAFHFVDNHNSDETIALYGSLGIGCLMNAGTPRKISAKVLSSVQHGVVNVHPGLLPEYRGCSAVEWAIYNDSRIGNTAHFMSEGYDTGPIIQTEAYDFPKDANYQSIRVHVYRTGCALAGKALAHIQATGLTPQNATVQDEAIARYWDPISEEKMAKVLEKINENSYKYQIL